MVKEIVDVKYPRLPCKLALHKKVQRYAKRGGISLTEATNDLLKVAFENCD